MKLYDHFHGVACGAALRAGKPVCSERPLGLNIGDARSLPPAGRRDKAPDHLPQPRHGHWAVPPRHGVGRGGRDWRGQGSPRLVPTRRTGRDTLPQGPQPVPEGLDWNLWLGPLAWREYHPDWMTYSHWRETCSELLMLGKHRDAVPPANWEDSFLDQGAQVRSGLRRNGCLECCGGLRRRIRTRTASLGARSGCRHGRRVTAVRAHGWRIPVGVALPIRKARLRIAESRPKPARSRIGQSRDVHHPAETRPHPTEDVILR